MDAKKNDQQKPPLDLLPKDALIEVARVLAYGADKYGKRNWEKGMAWSRLLASTARHLYAYELGEDKDPETNLSHLAHATCSLLFLLTYDLRDLGIDDRVWLENIYPTEEVYSKLSTINAVGPNCVTHDNYENLGECGSKGCQLCALDGKD